MTSRLYTWLKLVPRVEVRAVLLEFGRLTRCSFPSHLEVGLSLAEVLGRFLLPVVGSLQFLAKAGDAGISTADHDGPCDSRG